MNQSIGIPTPPLALLGQTPPVDSNFIALENSEPLSFLCTSSSGVCLAPYSANSVGFPQRAHMLVNSPCRASRVNIPSVSWWNLVCGEAQEG